MSTTDVPVSDFYGTDLHMRVTEQGTTISDLSVGPSGDLEAGVGLACAKQDLIARLMIERGELPWDPNFGSYLHLLIGEPVDEESLANAAQYAEDAIRSDPRVEDVTVSTNILSEEAIRIEAVVVMVVPVLKRVTNEQVRMDEDVFQYEFGQESVFAVREVRGTVGGSDYVFEQDKDYVQAGDILEWLDEEDAIRPDIRSIFLRTYEYTESEDEYKDALIAIPYSLGVS